MRVNRNLAVGLFLILLSFSVLAAEGIELIRPNYLNTSRDYLSNDDLLYEACLEGNVSTYLTCNDRRYEPECYDWEDSCKICHYDLSKLSCDNLSIRLSDGSVKLKKTIFIEFIDSLISKVSTSQMGDGSWNNDASDTAFGIFVLSQYNIRYDKQIEEALHWLKINRDNRLKCWPKDDCDVKETITTLSYLSMATDLDGYNNTARVFHDAKIWIEDQQTYFDDGLWTLDITVDDDNTTCTLSYSGTGISTSTFILLDDETQKYSFTPDYEANFNLTCDDDANFYLYNNNSHVVYTDSDEDIYYKIPKACWSKTAKWSSCDKQTTLYGAISNITAEKRQVAAQWLEDELTSALGGRHLYTSDEIKDTSLYLKYFGEDTTLIAWLVYKQNNDGSWGSGDANSRIISTAYATYALSDYEFAQKNEVLSDALTWIYTNNMETSWNSLEKRGVTALQLKNLDNSPPKVAPAVMNITGNYSLRLFNPSSSDYNNLNVSLMGDVAKEFDIGYVSSLLSFSYERINMTYIGTKPGKYFGFITINDNITEIVRAPVLLNIEPVLNISAPSTFNLFGEQSSMDVSVLNKNDNYVCSIVWNTSELEESTAMINSNQFTIDIVPKKTDDKELNVIANMTCEAESAGSKVYASFETNIRQYEDFPFTVEPEEIITTLTRETGFRVRNNLDEELKITLLFETKEEFFEIEYDKITLEPKKSKDIKIMALLEEGVNLTANSENKIILQSPKYTKNIDFIVTDNLNGITGFSVLGTITKYSFTVLYFFLFGLLLFGGYRYRSVIISKLPNSEKLGGLPYVGRYFTKSEEVVENETDEKKTEQNKDKTGEAVQSAPARPVSSFNQSNDSDVDELVEISRGLNMLLSGDESQLKEELKKEGFTQDQIEKDFKKDPFN